MNSHFKQPNFASPSAHRGVGIFRLSVTVLKSFECPIGLKITHLALKKYFWGEILDPLLKLSKNSTLVLALPWIKQRSLTHSGCKSVHWSAKEVT
jgi:hypothetical protein